MVLERPPAGHGADPMGATGLLVFGAVPAVLLELPVGRSQKKLLSGGRWTSP